MKLEPAQVVVVPWGTIEADCLSAMLQEEGLAPVPEATSRTAVCVLAAPRRLPLSRVHPVREDLVGLPTLLVVEALDARALALKQVTGAVAVLTWGSDMRTLLDAICSLAAGRNPMPSQRHRPVAIDPCSQMTEREREVLDLVASGHRDDEIAGRLGISPYTVRTHLQHAMTKLDVTHRRAAAAIVRDSLIMRSRALQATSPGGG